jgi:hypothetical protein
VACKDRIAVRSEPEPLCWLVFFAFCGKPGVNSSRCWGSRTVTTVGYLSSTVGVRLGEGRLSGEGGWSDGEERRDCNWYLRCDCASIIDLRMICSHLLPPSFRILPSVLVALGLTQHELGTADVIMAYRRKRCHFASSCG